MEKVDFPSKAKVNDKEKTLETATIVGKLATLPEIVSRKLAMEKDTKQAKELAKQTNRRYSVMHVERMATTAMNADQMGKEKVFRIPAKDTGKQIGRSQSITQMPTCLSQWLFEDSMRMQRRIYLILKSDRSGTVNQIHLDKEALTCQWH